MNTAHATERTLINVAVLHAPYKVEADLLAHIIAPLSAADKAELRAFLTAVSIPLLRFMPAAEAARLYTADKMTLVELANAINEAFDGVYQITMTHVLETPAPDPKHLMRTLEDTLPLLAA
jgi:hypothetical protein